MTNKKIYEINKAIKVLKLSGKKVYSNNFAPISAAGESIVSENSVVLIKPDHGINRVLFYTNDFCDLGKAISKVSIPLTLDIITKNKEDYNDELTTYGFKKFEVMRRLVNYDISEIVNKKTISLDSTKAYGTIATPQDTHLINQKLWSVFDTRVSHLLYDDELEESINNGEIIIRKECGQVVTILQRILNNNKFYINQVYNGSDSVYIHGIMGTELKKYYDMGGRYLYAWAQSSNVAANIFHAKYGMSFDGLYDVVYIKE